MALTQPGYYKRQRILKSSAKLLFSPKPPSKYEHYEQDTRNKISEFARNAGYDSPQIWAENILPKQVRNIPKDEKDLLSPGDVDWSKTSKAMQRREKADIGFAGVRNKDSPPKKREPSSSFVRQPNTIQFIPFSEKDYQRSELSSKIRKPSSSSVLQPKTIQFIPFSEKDYQPSELSSKIRKPSSSSVLQPKTLKFKPFSDKDYHRSKLSSKIRKPRSSSVLPSNTIKFIPFNYEESRLGKPFLEKRSRLPNKLSPNVVS
ncbi:hypothetical protein NEOLI_005480 [Neolecta irregularis DAH-3]|uniref:Uncharacterized protein n=1 Tax=Neolecta irregularis (strain DAH-3) TaxID=1198029 RepID=A0A1U7LLF1_NEOID|nr:hypothetical protein NEOLI_005480 [Neolecta irregularis DAH-3]|eukprot:OLL23485.1 hypothetical protein NEOLI_005480 [Neolecta irregularis DAH-3]